MLFGYIGKILRIDLSSGSIVTQSLDPALARGYLGGMGLGSRILYDELDPGTDALSPDNILVFASGPLNGTFTPASSRIDVSFKSITGMFGTANSGGFWGPELRYAGFDALVIKGKASSPAYIWIDDGKVEIRRAGHLWGKDTFETTDAIKYELSPSRPDRVRVAAIGVPGEKLVSFASLTMDYYHSASKCGIGAVMGSKNLKAIALRGTHRVPVAHPEKFEKVVRELLQTTFGLEAGGPSAVDTDLHLDAGELPGKNFQVDTVPHWANLCSDAEKRIAEKVRQACHACDRPCFGARVKEGPHAGLLAADLHSSAIRGWGATCYVDNLPDVYRLHDACERIGLDYQTSQTLIGFAMELYQRGMISKATTGGLALEWGDTEVILELMRRIAYRQGFGDILAEGSLAVAKRIGKGVESFAMQIGGLSMGPHEPRLAVGTTTFDRAFFLGYLTSPRGGDNVKTTHLAARYLVPAKVRGGDWEVGLDSWLNEFVECIDVPEDFKRRIYGNPPRLNRQGYEGKAAAMVFFENMTTVYNALGLCIMRRVGPTMSARLLSELTGNEMTGDELLKVGHRIFALMWAWNGREGVTQKDLDFPTRFYVDPIPSGPNKGTVLSREATNTAIAEWYELRGWDPEVGLPSRRTLEALGLKDVADDLCTRGVLKGSAKASVSHLEEGTR
ncbi:MAG: aldehyde ferredoxin oxidoreductase family protein [Chloroflexi bacterium]|nr:aldehyde ferredoxin oxidoreductase family protein [Chloroflexota bacterium]